MSDLRSASRAYLDGRLSVGALVQAAIATPIVDGMEADAPFVQPILGFGNVDQVDETALRQALTRLLDQ